MRIAKVRSTGAVQLLNAASEVASIPGFSIQRSKTVGPYGGPKPRVARLRSLQQADSGTNCLVVQPVAGTRCSYPSPWTFGTADLDHGFFLLAGNGKPRTDAAT